jgi:hypothetical protein
MSEWTLFFDVVVAREPKGKNGRGDSRNLWIHPFPITNTWTRANITK